MCGKCKLIKRCSYKNIRTFTNSIKRHENKLPGYIFKKITFLVGIFHFSLFGFHFLTVAILVGWGQVSVSCFVWKFHCANQRRRLFGGGKWAKHNRSKMVG